MNDQPTPLLEPKLRQKICTLLDLDGSDPTTQDLADLLLAATATGRGILLVDASGRNLLKLARLFSSLEGSELFHHFCSERITFKDLIDSSGGKTVWFLEEIDALTEGEQARLADSLLEDSPKDPGPGLLIASVSSNSDMDSLSGEFLEVLDAVITLPKLQSERLRNELLSNDTAPSLAADFSAEWNLLKRPITGTYAQELVHQVVALADKIASTDPTSVTERPPVDALRNQLRILTKLGELQAACGSPCVSLGNPEIQVALLAHRLRRIDSQGKTNREIVLSSALPFANRSAGSPVDESSALHTARETFLKIHNYLTTLVIGRDDDGHKSALGFQGVSTIDLMLAALFSEGHILFEDYPGTGKSYMIEKLSDCVLDDIVEPGIEFTSYKHIQCVPDLMPSDLTGGEIFAGDRMVFRPGPVFAYLVLIDEINRTTPKVQAALLEAMADRKVTIGNHEYGLGKVFFVLATQNPLDTVGTYPLPQAQLDRFIFKRRLETLDDNSVIKILNIDRIKAEPDRVKVSEIASAIEAVKSIPVGKDGKGTDDINPLFLSISRRFKLLCDTKAVVPEGCFPLKKGSTPSPRSLKKFLAGLKAIAFIEWAKGGGEPRVTTAHVQRLARDYFTHRITPKDDQMIDPETLPDTLGALVDLVVNDAIGELLKAGKS